MPRKMPTWVVPAALALSLARAAFAAPDAPPPDLKPVVPSPAVPPDAPPTEAPYPQTDAPVYPKLVPWRQIFPAENPPVIWLSEPAPSVIVIERRDRDEKAEHPPAPAPHGKSGTATWSLKKVSLKRLFGGR